MVSARKKAAGDAWGALLQVQAALVPVLDRRVRTATGIPLSWYDVLLELHGAPQRRLTMSELGDRVVLSRSRVSRVVDELAADGLITREPNPADARSAFATLSPAGVSKFRQAAPVYLSAIEEEFAQHLSDRELQTLTNSLHRVLTARIGPSARA